MQPRRALLPAIALVALGGLPVDTSAQQAPTPAAFVGSWKGPLDAGAMKLTLVFHVEQADGGGLTGTMDSPDQGAMGIPATSVSVEGTTLQVAIAAMQASYVATLSDDRTTLTRGQAAPAVRPQNPTLPLPYRTQEVQITSGAAGVTLAGTLSLPTGPGPFPAVVLVSGSGPQDRDETLMGHKPFLVLSDHLTRAGIAVLRYDDRGVAQSTGDFANATSRDFMADAVAAVAFLKTRPDMGPVGIVGHSEGGLIGPMAAAQSDAVSFVVMLAGPGLPGSEIIQLQSELIARAQGISDDVVALNASTQARLFDIVATEPDPATAAPLLRAVLQDAIASLPAGSASSEAIDAQVAQVNSLWFRYFLTYDPRPTLARVKVPVLALNGALDLQVPAEANLREVKAALTRGGNPDATTLLLPGLNHLFQKAETGSPTEYAQITETMNSAALDAVTSWILERFGHR